MKEKVTLTLTEVEIAWKGSEDPGETEVVLFSEQDPEGTQLNDTTFFNGISREQLLLGTECTKEDWTVVAVGETFEVETERCIQACYSVAADMCAGSPADDWATFAQALLEWCEGPISEEEYEQQTRRFAAQAVMMAGGEYHKMGA